MARLARLVVPGLPHHVTQRGNGRVTTRSIAISWGRSVPAKRLLFRTDGVLRKYSKIGTIVWLGIFLLLVWLAA